MTTEIMAPEEGDEVLHEGEDWFINLVTDYDYDNGEWTVDIDNGEEDSVDGIDVKWDDADKKWKTVTP